MLGMPGGIHGKAAASDKEGDQQAYNSGPMRDSKAGGHGCGKGTARSPEGRGLGT